MPKLGNKMMLAGGIIMLIGFALAGWLNIFLLIAGIMCIVNRKKLNKTNSITGLCIIAMIFQIIGSVVVYFQLVYGTVNFTGLSYGSIEEALDLVFAVLVVAYLATIIAGTVMGIIGAKRNREYNEAIIIELQYEEYLQYDKYFNDVVKHYGYVPMGLMLPVIPIIPPQEYKGLIVNAADKGIKSWTVPDKMQNVGGSAYF